MAIREVGQVIITADTILVRDFVFENVSPPYQDAAVREAVAWALRRLADELVLNETEGEIEVRQE